LWNLLVVLAGVYGQYVPGAPDELVVELAHPHVKSA
jgi:hypothetical protein